MIRNFLLLISLLFILSCDKESDPILPPYEPIAIPFEGTWTRQFEAGPGNLHDVQYSIYQDSIRYQLSGPIGNADYVLHRDSFSLENNRFIGHTTDDQYYLLFAKNVTTDSITVYKQTVETLEEGLILPVPSASTTANHGWNIFKKQ